MKQRQSCWIEGALTVRSSNETMFIYRGFVFRPIWVDLFVADVVTAIIEGRSL